MFLDTTLYIYLHMSQHMGPCEKAYNRHSMLYSIQFYIQLYLFLKWCHSWIQCYLVFCL